MVSVASSTALIDIVAGAVETGRKITEDFLAKQRDRSSPKVR
jgi:hypothetical protein